MGRQTLSLPNQASEDKHLQVFTEDLLKTSPWARKSGGRGNGKDAFSYFSLFNE